MSSCTCGHDNPDGARFCNSCGVPLGQLADPIDPLSAETRTETFKIPTVGGVFYRAKEYTRGVALLSAQLARQGWVYEDSNMPQVGGTVRVTFTRSPRPLRVPQAVGVVNVAHFGASDLNPFRTIVAVYARGRLNEQIQQWNAEAKQKGWITWFRYRYSYNSAPAVLIGYERPAEASDFEGAW